MSGHVVCAVLLSLVSVLAHADGRQACDAAAGSYLTGSVVQTARFAHGQFRKGVELSHSHLTLLADQDGRRYDVAIDNVFASGFDAQGRGVPPAIGAIGLHDRLELCGQLYDRGVGIHFVHTNCGAAPTPAKPDGWIKRIGGDGRAGANLEANPAYCSLFGRHR
jgi:hypothetical protein